MNKFARDISQQSENQKHLDEKLKRILKPVGRNLSQKWKQMHGRNVRLSTTNPGYHEKWFADIKRDTIKALLAEKKYASQDVLRAKSPALFEALLDLFANYWEHITWGGPAPGNKAICPFRVRYGVCKLQKYGLCPFFTLGTGDVVVSNTGDLYLITNHNPINNSSITTTRLHCTLNTTKTYSSAKTLFEATQCSTELTYRFPHKKPLGLRRQVLRVSALHNETVASSELRRTICQLLSGVSDCETNMITLWFTLEFLQDQGLDEKEKVSCSITSQLLIHTLREVCAYVDELGSTILSSRKLQHIIHFFEIDCKEKGPFRYSAWRTSKNAVEMLASSHGLTRAKIRDWVVAFLRINVLAYAYHSHLAKN